MTDQQIIAAAQEAGLCFPDCWGLVNPWEPTKDASADWGAYEQDKMQQLRHFAELIKAS